MAQGKYAKYVVRLVRNKQIQNKTHIGKITEAMEFDKRFFAGATHHIESFIVHSPGAGFHVGSDSVIDIIDGKEFRDMPLRIPVDEMSLFIGTDPQNPEDLGGEAECWLGEGEDAEKYIITKTSCVFFPAGLVHLPVYFRRVDRPFIYIVIVTSAELVGETVDKLPPGFSMD